MSMDLTGNRFGRLTVIERAKNDKFKHSQWLCECDCGTKIIVSLSHLRTGYTKSCGCLKKEIAKEVHTKHGKSYDPLYIVWCGMIYRCTNPNHHSYKNYGGRGVSVCDEWKDNPNCFIDWSISHGWKPGLQLDRINNSEGYRPENCHFVTPRINCNNTRRTRYIDGEPASLWFEKQNHHPSVNYVCFCDRFFRKGWDLDRSLLTPNRYLNSRRCKNVSK